jgi:rSAM/selenodomain-associated transferase 1
MTTLRIVIFAKVPLPGLVKTRLIPALGAQGAATLAERMLRHTVGEALAAELGTVELCCSPAEDPYWLAWNDIAGLDLSDQGDGDLGARMARTTGRIIESGESALLIGTDCPALDRRHLHMVAKRLREADAVMVPAHDGGYVALAVRRYHPRIFEHIPWSTAAVAASTLGRLHGLGWAVTVMASEQDIDDPEDLSRLPPSLQSDEVDHAINAV